MALLMCPVNFTHHHCYKPGLLEVRVRSQGPGDAALQHHLDAHAFGQTPFLVRAACKQVKGAVKQRAGDRNNLDACIGAQFRDDRQLASALRKPRQGAAQFKQHRIGGNQLRAAALGLVQQPDGHYVMPVRDGSERNQEARIDEPALHRA